MAVSHQQITVIDTIKAHTPSWFKNGRKSTNQIHVC